MFSIRSYKPDTDKFFILSSWLRSYRKSDAVKGINNTVFYGQHHQLVETLLSSERVGILYNEEEPDQIIGWICVDNTPGVLHYVYVKNVFRRNGLANDLIASACPHVQQYTHLTPVVDKLTRLKLAVYNPYLLWRR